MEPNSSDVKKIIEYLEGKIESLKQKLKTYESPIMQDMARNSPHLQMDYVRLTAELQANEDNLLAIRTFTATTESAPAKEKSIKQKTDAGKDGKANK